MNLFKSLPYLIILLMTTAATCSEKETYIQIETTKGNMVLKLYDVTPLHRDNMVKLVKEGYYDDLLFHRVMDGFMIQGGDPDSRTAEPGQQLGSGGPDYTIEAEILDSLFHKKGALAAARTPDGMNPEKRSSGSQFYILHGRTFTDSEMDRIEMRTGREIPENRREIYRTEGGYPFLDQDYTIFGEVVEGMEVIDAIAAVAVDPAKRPLEDIKMKVSLVKRKGK